MYLFTIIGHTGQGKSTWVKKFIEGKNYYVFDVNNEYDVPNDMGAIYPQMRNVELNMKRFVSIAGRLRNTNIICEDATGFLRGRIQEDFARLLVAKRHTGNNYFLLFHSINRVPPEIMEMSNYVILFKTIDSIDNLKKFKNDNLTQNFLALQKEQQFSNRIIKLI